MLNNFFNSDTIAELLHMSGKLTSTARITSEVEQRLCGVVAGYFLRRQDIVPRRAESSSQICRAICQSCQLLTGRRHTAALLLWQWQQGLHTIDLPRRHGRHELGTHLCV